MSAEAIAITVLVSFVAGLYLSDAWHRKQQAIRRRAGINNIVRRCGGKG